MPSRRGLALVALGALAAVSMLIPAAASVGSTAASSAQRSHSTAHALATAPPCPSVDTCETIPGNSSASGGTVQIGPTSNLGTNEWVYVNLYGFAPGSILRIDWCTNTASLPTPPLCLLKGYPLIANTVYTVEALSDGTESLSYQVLEIDNTDNPFQGSEPGNPSATGNFYCNATSPCSIDITNIGVGGQASQVATPQNTAVTPISFAASFSGCGSSAASVSSESEFGIEFVLPVAARASCSLPDPSIAFNTAADGLGAVTSLAAGSTQVAFTDDPEVTSQQDVLNQGNYKLIPVALTANVVGFKAQDFNNGVLFPLNSLDLTPTMVAGLLTGVYNTPLSSDPVKCSKTLGCPAGPCVINKGHKTTICPLFVELNYQPGFTIPQQYEAFVRSDSAGSTGLLFDWLCNAPIAPVPISIPESTSTYTDTLTEPTSGSGLLETAFGGLSAALDKCPVIDQYPPEAVGAAVTYTSYNDPNQQEIKMNGYVQPGIGGSNAVAAFSTMNWAESRYYGLRTAALQNAAGQFVLPSQSSLDAAVADGTTNADGTITPNSATTDASAYPMASIVYAAVCADPVPTQEATNITNMLNQLLAVTGPNSTDTLPDGFVPLPSSLVTQAQTDITNDIVGGGSTNGGCPPSAGGSSSSGGSGGSPGGSASSGSKGSSPTATNTPPAVVGNRQVSASPQTPAPRGSGQPAYSGLNKPLTPGAGGGTTGGKKGGLRLGFLSLSSSSSRVFLPLALLLGLLALVMGLFMVLSPSLRAQVLGVGHRSATRARKSAGAARSWVGVSGLSGSRRKW